MRKLLIFILLIAFLSFKADGYQISFEGLPSVEIFDIVDSVSELKSTTLRQAPSLFTLKKRAESDKNAIIDVMHAFGFYDAEVTLHFLGEFPDTLVQIVVSSGPQYYFGEVTMTDNKSNPLSISGDFSVTMGLPARTDAILDTEEQILNLLGSEGYPLATLVNRDVVVDQASKTVCVAYTIDMGPIAYFGPLQIDGLKKVRRSFIEQRVAWEEGGLFNPQLVACTDLNLQQTGLFSYVMITPVKCLKENGTLPMLIQLEEKKFRHIGAGVSYSTDESAGLLLQWSHDNFSGWGDALALIGEASAVVKRATLLYARPHFYGLNQDLLYSAEIRREDTPGFIEREISLLIRLDRKIAPCLHFNYGGRYERLVSTKSNHNANYNLVSLPLQLRWDTSNRLLNPTRGTIVSYCATPYQAFVDSSIFFFKHEILATTYQPMTPKGGILMALSAQAGSIMGQSTIEVPAPKRFYSGSSTSLRGYKYLTVSPLVGNKPVGGRSYFIFQIEPRFRIYQALYLAPFFDIGNVYATPWPKWHEKMLRSYGVGLRYLTPVGPFRLDIGFPIDKRRGIDKTFQIYASIGQTF